MVVSYRGESNSNTISVPSGILKLYLRYSHAVTSFLACAICFQGSLHIKDGYMVVTDTYETRFASGNKFAMYWYINDSHLTQCTVDLYTNEFEKKLVELLGVLLI